jgi:hypothetical protein
MSYFLTVADLTRKIDERDVFLSQANKDTAMSYYLTVTDLIRQIDGRDVFQDDVETDAILRLVLAAESLANRGRREAHKRFVGRIDRLERVLQAHIRTYRVDDQHPDPDAEAHRLMQQELHGRPKTTTENDQT